ncbi:MAG TPA: hypothetical protein VJB92_02075 [Candidatus Paceibacterota bacterium]
MRFWLGFCGTLCVLASIAYAFLCLTKVIPPHGDYIFATVFLVGIVMVFGTTMVGKKE